MPSDPQKLITKNQQLTHSEHVKVVSHTQRDDGDWVLHSLMIENCEAPFQFKRQGKYKNLQGARVNMTYYTESKMVAGIPFEVMKVVRIKRS